MTRPVYSARLATRRPRPKHRRRSEKASMFVRRRARPMLCSSERRRRRSDVRRPQLLLREGRRSGDMRRRRTTKVLPGTAGRVLRHLTTAIIPTHILLAVDTSTLHLNTSNLSSTGAGRPRHRPRATIAGTIGGPSAVESTTSTNTNTNTITSSSSSSNNNSSPTVLAIPTKNMNARGEARDTPIIHHRPPTMVLAVAVVLVAVVHPFQTARRKKTRR
mmetsp:Transcript_18281/g.52312  ORF Transcript_18281/g.52312 Transcript_18281/m.52312 type:complete len:218 (-) Transcript_18281:3792-4445(-)